MMQTILGSFYEHFRDIDLLLLWKIGMEWPREEGETRWKWRDWAGATAVETGRSELELG